MLSGIAGRRINESALVGRVNIMVAVVIILFVMAVMTVAVVGSVLMMLMVLMSGGGC